MLAVSLTVWYPSLLKCLIWGKIQYFPGGPEESPQKVKKSRILWVKVLTWGFPNMNQKCYALNHKV